ncbi:MAG: VWA domain-containing protein [Blastocatellia bacterium]|nr:VWA domain-containing protein [Blastocatellia bacterium]
MKVLQIMLLGLLIGGAALAQTNKPKPQPPSSPTEDKEETLRIDSTLVTIPVSVIDLEGKYLLNLTPKDFRLYENDSQQEITNFATIEVPISLVLMIDTSRSTKFKIEDIQRAASTFVEQLRPTDRVMVVSFDDKVRVQCEFTSDRASLKQAIAKTKTGTGTKLYEAINLVMNQKLGAIQGRKAIVLFTDGVDTESKYGTGKQSMFDVEKNEVIVYSIQYDTAEDIAAILNGDNQPQKLISSQPTTEEFQLATRYLRGLALRSGGRVQQAETLANVNEAFALIAEELRHQYSLGYYPTQAGTSGEFRRVRVEVLQPHRNVRARDGYRVGN